MKKRRFALSTTHIILLSFLVAILLGTLLLSLPFSAADGQAVPLIDALFTATTATCVTGLVVVPTATAWSPFGQAVILLLIQIGGLGLITVMSALMVLLHRRVGLGGRLLMQDAFNLNTLAGLAEFVKKVVLGTLAVEGVGALLYMTVFIPEFGWKGIWISVFTAVSAFCNAGIDIIAENSLCNYVTHPVINGVTALLIILGGLGYIVWWDVLRVAKLKGNRFRRLTLHSKLAIVSTLILIFGGGLVILLLEYQNPATIGSLNFWEKVQASLFQSVTFRTAGFMTFPQEGLTNAAALVGMLLMIIGGSPVGTAGGIKTVTAAVLLCTAFASVREKTDVSVFGRRLSRIAVRKAVAVACTSFAILFVSTLLLSLVSSGDLLDLAYETVSATATVGLSRNMTASFGAAGKWILIATMYFGRVGPISLALAFKGNKGNQQVVRDPAEEISVG